MTPKAQSTKAKIDWMDLSSVQFSHSVVSDSLQPHELQHAWLPCPTPFSGVCSKSCPLSQWCHLILCQPLLHLSSVLPSIRVFSNGSALCIRWPKYWSFSFSISPSNEHPGLISFRMDWLDLLAVQGTPKSLLQHHRLKASFLRHTIFFMVQFSQEYEFRDNDLIAFLCDEGMPLAPSVSPFETSLNQSLTFWCIFTSFSPSGKSL